MSLPQVARWKAESDKDIKSLEKHNVFKLVPIASFPAGYKLVSTRWVFKIKVNGTYKGRLVVQGFSKSPGVDTPGVGPEVPLNQLEEKKLLNEEEKRRYQAITGAVYVSHTSYPLRHPLHGQPAGEGNVQARENSHGGGQNPSLLDRVHRLVQHLQLGRLQACCLLGCQLAQQPRQQHVHVVIIHRNTGQRRDQLQGGTAGADCIVLYGGRARGGSSDNEGGGILR